MGDHITDLEKDSFIRTGTGVAARMVAQPMLAERFAFNASNLPEYQGWARIGTGTGTAGWALCKFLYDGTKRIARVWANGDAEFDKIWNNRTGYDYS